MSATTAQVPDDAGVTPGTRSSSSSTTTTSSSPTTTTTTTTGTVALDDARGDGGPTVRLGYGGLGRENARPLYRTQTAPTVSDSRHTSSVLAQLPAQKRARGHTNDGVGGGGGVGVGGRTQAGATRGKIFVDVAEDEYSYTIFADLPGCAKSDIVVLLKENVLLLRAERRRPRVLARGAVCHRAERFYGQISRALLLPTSCSDSVSANYEAGVLVVEIQKKRKNGAPDAQANRTKKEECGEGEADKALTCASGSPKGAGADDGSR